MTDRTEPRAETSQATSGLTKSPAEKQEAPASPVTLSTKAKLMGFSEKWATLLGFAAIVAYFWVAAPATFGTIGNFKAILDQAAVTVILAVGLTAVLAVAEFDLSFPYVLGFSSAVATLSMTDLHWPTWAAIGLGIVVAVGANAITGFVVAQQRVSSFVVTLGFGFVWLGIADGMTSSRVISQGMNGSFTNLILYRPLGFTLATWVALVFAVLIGILFRWTVAGRNIMAVGSNPSASRLAGLPLSRIRIFAYVLLGLAVGVAAIVITSRQAQYTPGVGDGLFLSPYVAAFFGMSVLGVRRFNVLGTVVGALFMGTLQTGLVVIGAASWLYEVIQGAALLIILLIARRAT